MLTEGQFRSAVKRRLRITNQALETVRGMSKPDIGRACGVGATAVNNWESERKVSLPGHHRFYLYTTVIGVPIEWFYGGDATRLPQDIVTEIRRLEALERARKPQP